jgi:preprotein translocase subunit YajC
MNALTALNTLQPANVVLAMMPPAQGGDASGSMISTLIMFGLMVVIMYFFIIRPQKKRQDDQQKMVDTLKQGDKVILSSGMHGSISSVDDKTVLVLVADNVRIRFEKSAVVGVTPKESKDSKDAKDVKKLDKADAKADAKAEKVS